MFTDARTFRSSRSNFINFRFEPEFAVSLRVRSLSRIWSTTIDSLSIISAVRAESRRESSIML